MKLAFTENARRTPDFEGWVLNHATERLRMSNAPSAGICASAIAVSKPEHVAGPERELLGIIDPTERGGILLNVLIDLYYFRLEILATAT